MLKRRVPRIAVSGFLLAVAVSGLTACRTAPSVAAYVGDEQVTVAELDAAVETVSLKVPVGPDRRTPLRDVALLENLHAMLKAVLQQPVPAAP